MLYMIYVANNSQLHVPLCCNKVNKELNKVATSEIKESFVDVNIDVSFRN